MDRKSRRRLDEIRREVGPVENQVIDDLAAAELDRTAFLRRAGALGLSVPAIGVALSALGYEPLAFAGTRAAKAGGRLRIGVLPAPGGAIEPILFSDGGTLATGSVCGEFLLRATQDLRLAPELALSWKPDVNARVWTFKLRPNVKFQTGQTMTADDVVATFKSLLDPNSGSQALSAFSGVLSPDGVHKGGDDLTVIFDLETPTASFPYLTSSTTYQAIILPANYQKGSFTTTPQCTGAFKLTAFTPGVGATYERFDGWWGGRAPLDGVDMTYYASNAAADAAMLGGSIDLVNNVSVQADRALVKSPRVQLFHARAATHRELPMRVDMAPFKDYRVRQAIALSIDRPAAIKTLYDGIGDLGNDSPFAPAYPSTVKVAQRKRDIAKAKQLMAAAGQGKGLKVTLSVQGDLEMPAFAQIVQRAVRDIGIDMKLKVMKGPQYFAGTAKTTPWLNDPMTLSGWGSRAVPNVFLTAAYASKGIWNAAHYKSKKFDSLAKSYVGAIALADQRKYAKQIELLLLHDTPAVIAYFAPNLAVGAKNIRNYYVGSNGQAYLSRTSLA